MQQPLQGAGIIITRRQLEANQIKWTLDSRVPEDTDSDWHQYQGYGVCCQRTPSIRPGRDEQTSSLCPWTQSDRHHFAFVLTKKGERLERDTLSPIIYSGVPVAQWISCDTMAESQFPQPFGLVPAGQKLITIPTQTPTPTSFLYAIPPPPQQPGTAPTKSFSHIVVFLFPGIVLPPNTAAAIYLVTPPTAPGQTDLNFKFLGGIGEGKESAVFKITTPSPSTTTASSSPSSSSQTTEGGGNVVIGISIEPAESVAAQMAQLASSSSSTSGALVPVSRQGQGQGQPPSTLVLAQRIIKNAFNFLAGFSGTAGQVEVVPLRAFEDWWRKFENRVRTDPGFLERDD